MRRRCLHRARPRCSSSPRTSRARPSCCGWRSKTANPTGKVYPAANYLLGLATLFQVPQIDPQAEKNKSCDVARQEETLLAAAD